MASHNHMEEKALTGHAHRRRHVSMKIFLLGCCLLLLCVACAGPGRLASPQSAPREAPATQRKAVDSGCAYFYYLAGKWAEDNGRLEEARQAYKEALGCDRSAVHVMQNLALLLARMGRQDEAVAWMEKIRRQQPAAIQNLTFVANLYAAMDMEAKAVAIYHQILTKEPGNVNALLLLGTLYAQDGQYAKARKMFERLVRIDRSSYLGHYYLGKLYQEQHQFDKALVAYRQALALNWSADLALETGGLYEKVARYSEAGALYRQVLARDPTDLRARRGLVGVYLKQGDLDRAMTELKELRRYAADVPQVDFAIGRLLIEQKRYPEAIAKLSKLLAEDPGLHTARYLLAFAYYRQGDRGRAAGLLRKIPASAKAYEDATLLLAKILEEEKDLSGVEALLKGRLAGKATRRPVFYSALAAFYQDHDQQERGRKVYAEALAHYPNNPQVLFQYGLFLDRAGQSEEAMTQMQKVIAIEPHNAYALNYVGYTWADRGVHLNKALDYIKQAVALRPQDGFIRDSLGWVYYRLGKIDRARAELEKARDLAADDPHILEHLGDVYRAGHEPHLARKVYQQAFKFYKEKKEKKEVERKLKALRP